MRGWITAFVAAVALAVLPGAASGAALVPLAPSSAWPSDPIHATAPPGDPRLFVAERGGGVRIFENGALRPTPFLTAPNVDVSGERGLLSIAFAPDYASSGLFYVFVVQKETEGAVRVLEFRRSATDPSLADPASERITLEVPHVSDDIHYGGQIAFGPDGFLYVTIGEAGVPANAQDKANLLGKVLRIDPVPGGGYVIPPSNPFAGLGGGGTMEEIFALGLRNPYRASFAPNGDLIVLDVGSKFWEEVNTGNLAGANLGWPICEGACTPSQPGLIDPFFQYGNDANDPGPEATTGCAIVGGHVVRDQLLGELFGRYLYGDLCRSDLRTIDLDAAGGDPQPAGLSLPAGSSLLGFGEDSGCGIYVMTTGTAYHVAMSPSSPPSSGAPLCAIVDPVGKPPQRQELRLRVRAARRQRLRGHVKAVAICSQACTLHARGRLHFFKRGRKAGSARLIPVSRPVKAGVRNRFRLAVLKVRVRQRAKRVLKQGGRVTARVTMVAFDGTGNRAVGHAPVRLIR